MTKIYLVTSGEYSGYEIEAAFSTEEKARHYAGFPQTEEGATYHSGDVRIEEFDLDVPSEEVFRMCWRCDILKEDKTEGYFEGTAGTILSQWSNIQLAKPSERAEEVRDWGERLGVGSYESPEHARKLAVEAYQAYLRSKTLEKGV